MFFQGSLMLMKLLLVIPRTFPAFSSSTYPCQRNAVSCCWNPSSTVLPILILSISGLLGIDFDHTALMFPFASSRNESHHKFSMPRLPDLFLLQQRPILTAPQCANSTPRLDPTWLRLTAGTGPTAAQQRIHIRI